MNKFYCLLFFLISNHAFAFTNVDALHYIEKYKEIAVTEMHKNGIPASIKMAQALLESNCGKSDLAVSANNHFGIKCGGAWQGDTYYKKDDDLDKHGRLRPSCFRVFNSPEHSFMEHSNFLKDPAKAYRYGSLFLIDKTDYKSWAWGLKKSGYATNPAYANLLISLIEKYSLYTFDYYEDSNVEYVEAGNLVAQAKDVRSFDKIKSSQHPTSIQSTQSTPSSNISLSDQIYVNDRKALIIQPHQTIDEIAKEYGLSIDKIEQYNEFFEDEKQYQKEGDFVFLEKKNRKYRGSASYHVVKEGEDLLSISQKYGLRLSTLERKNKMTLSMVPIPGEKIKLKGKSIATSEIPLTYDDVHIIESNEVSTPTIVDQPKNVKNDNPYAKPTLDLEKESLVAETTNTNFIHYEIQKGDTLYKISKQFSIPIADIVKSNHLESNNLSIGQLLKLYR